MNDYLATLNKIYSLHGGIIDLRLDRVKRALALFDQPEAVYPSIHIAGTNGKGSTAAMLHGVLSTAGYRTALYTSPHLVSFTERMRIDDEEISEADVVGIADEIWQRTAVADVQLTFFEFVTVMAFIFFARRQVEIAVIEVGLGGRLDATNVITPLVSVITTISKDHEAYLGPDELSIAREKGGIIKPGVPVICGKVSAEVSRVLKDIAGERRSRTYSLGVDFSFFLKNEGLFDYTGIKRSYLNLELALRGRHQRGNASLALAALELIGDYFPVKEDPVRTGLRKVRWAGRLETMLERPTVLLDGAHNPEGVQVLVDELGEISRGRKIKLLFATMADKEWEIMLRSLVKVADEVVFTKVEMERSADPHELSSKLHDPIRRRIFENSRVALRTLLNEAGADDLILVAGSLYLLGETRPMLQELAAAETTENDAANSPIEPS